MTILLGGEARPQRPTRLTQVPLLTRLTVSSPAGSVDLTERPWRVVKARGLTEVNKPADVASLPGRAGMVRRRLTSPSVMEQAREIELELMVGHDASVSTPERLSREVSRLGDVLDEELFPDGEVAVTGVRSDGGVRYVPAVHAPIAGDMDPLAWWQTVWQPTVRLLVTSPSWRSAAEPITWAFAPGAGPMLPFFPLKVGSSTVIGAANPVVVEGNRTTYPTLSVSGPATSVTCSRADGSTWTLVPPSPLLAGQTITVRHDPDVGVSDDLETVEGPDGEPWYRYLTAGSELWGLRPGVEEILVSVPGANTTTSATLSWEHRWRSLL